MRAFFRAIRKLPAAWVIPLVLLAIGGLIMGTVYGYRTYTYVQHDNDFCLSCHLMQDPFERFARSAHRGLGCKACHQPTTVVRAQMGLTQIIEQPESLTVHAEVPNQRCIDCHVDGDPDQWRLISSSVGHRIHLESKDPGLRDLKCVECHSSSLHEFSATSKTCAQSGCHQDTKITLGKMGNLTTHCIACHDFSRPVAAALPADSLRIALQPNRDLCLSCHQMRVLVSDMPADEPHKQACGLCHDPHKQKRPADAVQTCANSGCHERVDTLTPLHRGLEQQVLANCTSCHRAHQFRLNQPECIDCHRDILTRPSPRRWSSAPPAAMQILAKASFVHDRSAVRTVAQVNPSQQSGSVPFEHRRHQGLDCSSCHVTTRATSSHGALKVTTFRDCQACHHAGGPTQTQTCTRCHAETEFRARSYAQPMTLRISAGTIRRERAVLFSHEDHPNVECAQCHTDPVTRAASKGDCQSCHRQHHQPTVDCRACHAPAPPLAHNLKSHTTCAGSGCHSQLPVAGMPRTREFCLVCHQDLVQHKLGGNCAQCHVLPTPRGSARGNETS